MYKIYDHHAILNTNTTAPEARSIRTDIWAEYRPGNQFQSKNCFSEASGIKPGMM
jgi:hypothetical protein